MTRAFHRRIRRPRLARRSRRFALPIVIGIILAQFGTAFAASDTFYLKSDGVSVASLSQSAPSAGTLPNYDPGRDDSPGLQLDKTRSTYQEADPTKHQIWVAAPNGIELAGPATLTFWSAMTGFHPDKKGHVEAHLLDCNPSGSECTLISSGQLMLPTWANGSETWVQHSIDFGTVNHTVPQGKSLAVKLMVDNRSGGDMWFAYDTDSYASSLTVQAAPPGTTTTQPPPPPPPTTTTTPTPPPPTTTTTQPTTTSQPPPPTTTAPPASTTTQPPKHSATTTTTLAPPPTSGSSTTTTTTTTVPIGGGATAPTTTIPDSPQPPSSASALPDTPTEDEPVATEDIALSPLPDDKTGGDEEPDALSGHLLDGLEIVISPAAASSLVSPLLLFESLVGAFSETGRSLLIPGLLLVVGVLWAERRRRGHGPKLEAIDMNQAHS